MERKQKMNVRRIMLAVLTLLVCTGVYAKGKIRLAPGASCYAWNINTKNKPDSVPNGAFVDEAGYFDAFNIRACEELRTINRGFIMWEGYLQVPKTDDYRFTFVVRDHYLKAYAKIFVNNKVLLTREFNGSRNMTAQATMKRGFVKIRIYFSVNEFGSGSPGSYSRAGFNLKFAPKTAMKMTDITPAVLFHPVDSER